MPRHRYYLLRSGLLVPSVGQHKILANPQGRSIKLAELKLGFGEHLLGHFHIYDRFKGEDGDIEGTNTKLLLAGVRFSAAAEPGLELVDIVVNATRRALVGTLGEAGWSGIPQLMIHRLHEPYIQFLIVGDRTIRSIALLIVAS